MRKLDPAQREEETADMCYRCQTPFAYKSDDVFTDSEGKFVICPECSAFNVTGKTREERKEIVASRTK